MDIQLFLAHADDHRPVLADGLPRSSAAVAPAPGAAPPAPTVLANRSAPVDSLHDQRWAILAPRGPEGDRLLRLIAPLRRRREEQQRAEAHVYRVDPGMDFGAANRWIQGDYWDEVNRNEDDLARYVLVLGGADLVSWELQQMLGSEAFVGRLAFPDDRGYEAYVDKALRCDAEVLAPSARALFYAVRDGSAATVDGHAHLVAPSLELARARAQRGSFPAAEILELGGAYDGLSDGEIEAHAQQMLREAERSRAGLLFSMSHGLGAPGAGWPSPDQQRAQQGALVLGRSGARLTARDVATRPFIPGGIWFLFACFGAGTPARSAYHHWLDQLHRVGHSGPAEHVLRALPRAGEPPFVAALPQAALANPDGPLGVIGHVDLAWTWSFLDYEHTADGAVPRRRAERFQGLLRSLVEGHRLGVAHQEVSRFFGSLSTELSTMDGEDAARAAAGDPARQVRRAALWMQRQDLCAYVLLGDPAARLPIDRWPLGLEPRSTAPAARPAAPPLASLFGFTPVAAPPTPPPAARDPRRLEEAVLAVIRGEGERAAAARHGLSEADVQRGVRAFLEAGRAALQKLWS